MHSIQPDSTHNDTLCHTSIGLRKLIFYANTCRIVEHRQTNKWNAMHKTSLLLLLVSMYTKIEIKGEVSFYFFTKFKSQLTFYLIMASVVYTLIVNGSQNKGCSFFLKINNDVCHRMTLILIFICLHFPGRNYSVWTSVL